MPYGESINKRVTVRTSKQPNIANNSNAHYTEYTSSTHRKCRWGKSSKHRRTNETAYVNTTFENAFGLSRNALTVSQRLRAWDLYIFRHMNDVSDFLSWQFLLNCSTTWFGYRDFGAIVDFSQALLFQSSMSRATIIVFLFGGSNRIKRINGGQRSNPLEWY